MKIDPDLQWFLVPTSHWTALLRLIGQKPRDQSTGRDLVLRVKAENRLLKFWHSRDGRLALEHEAAKLSHEDLGQYFPGSRVVDLQYNTIQNIAQRWQAQSKPGMELVDQLFLLLKFMLPAEDLKISPAPKVFGAPSFLRQGVSHLLWPTGRCLVFLWTHEGRVYCSLILRQSRHGVDLFTTDDAFPELPRPENLGPEWIHELVPKVEEKFGRVHLAASMELRSYWDYRETRSSTLRAERERQGRMIFARLPTTWRLLLWGFEKSRPRRRSAREPLNDDEWQRFPKF